MKKTLIIIMFCPTIIFSQDFLVKKITKNINTKDAEINFFQKNDSVAYFTALFEKNKKKESIIYKSFFGTSTWGPKIKSKYNFDGFNTANVFFEKIDERVFFSVCGEDMRDCKIVYIEKDQKEGFNEISEISSEGFFNTQPFVNKHENEKVMYFVSDRAGGFGGLDIWLSIIDKKGNFGVPINAGKNINTLADEVTPFYNNKTGEMYFSSNKKGGKGGFDIYKSEGRLNLWEAPANLQQLNTDGDELYLTFYNEKSGYFSSNRLGATTEKTDYCCNDVFSFEYHYQDLDTSQQTDKILSYIPLRLYFHNDEPDCCTMDTITQKTYKDAYVSYFKMKPYYQQKNPNLSSFFEEELKKNFNNLNELLEILLDNLSKGKKIELKIRGYSSPLHDLKYNKNLSKRRISSVINYLRQFKNNEFKRYFSSKKLIITELSLGESSSPKNVSDNPKNTKASIYSVEAMLERKIEIVDIILK